MKKQRRLIWTAVAAAVVITMTGCSLLLVRKPPPRPLWDRIGWTQCTQHQAWPVIDSLVAVGSAIALAMPFLVEPASASVLGTGQVASNTLQLAGWSFSAWYGFRATERCRAFWIHQRSRRGQGGPAQPAAAASRPAEARPALPAPVTDTQPSAPPRPGQGGGSHEGGVLEPPRPLNPQ